MITLNRATNNITIHRIIAVGVAVILVLMFISNYGQLAAQSNEQALNMHDLIQHIVDKNYSLYVTFVTPIVNEKGLLIPDDIKTDGRVTGQRQLRELGTDHICFNEAGDGIVDVYCIPFSNIASIKYTAPDTTDK